MLDQAAFFGLFVSGSWLLLTKGPVVLMTLASLLVSYLRLAAPVFQ